VLLCKVAASGPEEPSILIDTAIDFSKRCSKPSSWQRSTVSYRLSTNLFSKERGSAVYSENLILNSKLSSVY
jgi:hypothetical protein